MADSGRLRALGGGIAGLILTLPLPAVSRADPAPSLAAAKTFLTAIYARYKRDGNPVTIEDPQAAKIYSPSLLALIKDDEKAMQDEVGVLDGDPICDCQDFDIGGVSADVRKTGADTAAATVAFENLGKPDKVALTLRATAGAWLIDDIDIPELGSLRTALKGEIDYARKQERH